MSPGDFLTILYLAYLDMEAEKKRKKEEEDKKKGRRKLTKKEQEEINKFMSKGGRLPAEVIAKMQRRAREKAQHNDDSSSYGGIDMEDLIDEM